MSAPQRLHRLCQVPSMRRAQDTERWCPTNLQTMCGIKARLQKRIVPSA
jgi:hypothetical protein